MNSLRERQAAPQVLKIPLEPIELLPVTFTVCGWRAALADDFCPRIPGFDQLVHGCSAIHRVPDGEVHFRQDFAVF